MVLCTYNKEKLKENASRNSYDDDNYVSLHLNYCTPTTQIDDRSPSIEKKQQQEEVPERSSFRRERKKAESNLR